MTVTYTEDEQWVLDNISHANELQNHEIEELAYVIKQGVWVAVELGRCPSTDVRTYILHTSSQKPRFDYYGAEYFKKKTK
jgi:hypothetical protein